MLCCSCNFVDVLALVCIGGNRSGRVHSTTTLLSPADLSATAAPNFPYAAQQMLRGFTSTNTDD
jgi:hypothetical protein